jgi:hypothetical protein
VLYRAGRRKASGRAEVTADRIWCPHRCRVRDGGAVSAAQTDSLEPDGPHDPCDALVVALFALVAEFGGDPGGSVGAAGLLVDLAYPDRE